MQWLLQQGFDDLIGVTRSAASLPIRHIRGDISDAAVIHRLVQDIRPTRIIHLAGLQTPDCQAFPFAGLAVNVEGTNHLWRAAAELGSELRRVVFASSAAVYGPRSLYPGPAVREDDGLQPPNLYGHWKVAGEGATQALFMETGVSAVSLRLATTYGPGRDRGLTSAPTSAMKAIVAGERFEMPYAGREHYHYVHDVGAAFAMAAVSDFAGYGVFNLRGRSLPTDEFVQKVREVAAAEGLARGEITFLANPPKMPFVCDLDEAAICQQFPQMPLTELEAGIGASLRHFASA